MKLSRCKPTILALFFCQLLLLMTAAHAKNNRFLSQDEAKAVLIYNFIKHTQWPHSKQSVIEVGFLGVSAPLVQSFKRISAEANINGKVISPEILQTYQSGSHLEVLVLGPKYNRALAEIGTKLNQTQTLIISDSAVDKTSTMINFTYPQSDKISFEVNKSNILFEGLKVSNDVLLYGGSEIDVAGLYNQMEEALFSVKEKLLQQESVLYEQHKTVSKQADKIREDYGLIAEKNIFINEQKKALAELILKLQIVDNELNLSQLKLSENQKYMRDSQQKIIENKSLIHKLTLDIQKNKSVLTDQNKKIQQQKLLLGRQSSALQIQEGTIEVQRDIIAIAFIVLLVITALIIYRQKKALEREHELLEKEAHLVEMQQQSLNAYQLSLKVKNDFIIAINHELKTPMHIMNSAFYNIHQGDEVQSNLDFLENATKQMTLLINDMLMYSELQSEHVQSTISSAPVRKEIIAAVDSFREKASMKSIELHCEIADNLPPFVLVDIAKLRRVIEKILCNACKFTDAGLIDIVVRCDVTEHTQLVIKVSDTGIGIAPDVLENIYEPFVQNDSGLSRRYEGLGIGLSICKNVMKLLGGDIVISSKVGEGTEVLLSLPIKIPTADQLANSHSGIPSPLITERETVLLVEDNDVSRMVMEKLLSGLGYRCISAVSGFEAIELIDEHEPELVLMDIQMPEMNGIECTKRVRSANGFQPSIVALTANLVKTVEEDCFSAGMNAVLSKPVSAEKLLETLEYCSKKNAAFNK